MKRTLLAVAIVLALSAATALAQVWMYPSPMGPNTTGAGGKHGGGGGGCVGATDLSAGCPLPMIGI